jgi:hypothetical protein
MSPDGSFLSRIAKIRPKTDSHRNCDFFLPAVKARLLIYFKIGAFKNPNKPCNSEEINLSAICS